MATAPLRTSYDAIPYPSIPFPETHPDRLAAVARIFGLAAPPLETCRVLELGCSMGGNLLAISQMHPRSRCLGIDASSHQIAEGWKAVQALGSKNVQLRHLDILDVDDELGEFDYIISHGVYSWVPARVQNKMLEICQRHLAPSGVAYISYNTYPGWHIRGIVRDMMFYRGLHFGDAKTQLTQAKAMVEFVAQTSKGSESPYQRLLQAELKQLGRMNDYYLHHEYLEEHNQPLYFHEFAKRLAVNGLQYLGEADFSMMISSNFSPETARTLHEIGAHDIVQMEQYMDFVRCRYFRKTLICHSGVRLNRAIDANVVKGLYLASCAAPVEPPSDEPGSLCTFETPSGARILCKAAITKAAMVVLQREWPIPLSFGDLLARSRDEVRRGGHSLDQDASDDFFASEMLVAIGAGVAEMRVEPANYGRSAGAQPAASALARWQAGQGYQVTNLRGESVTLDEIHRQTLKLLDGSRNRGALTEAMLAALRAQEFVIRPDDGREAPVTGEAEMRNLLEPALVKVLENLGNQAFFATPVH